MRAFIFPCALAVAVAAAVIGLSGGGLWTVPVLLAAGTVAMWTAPHDDPPVRPGFPADQRNRKET